MHRKFIALVLSGSLAVTSLTAQPVKADDTAEWIAGAAALAIIGLAISEANKDPKPTYNYGHTYTPHSYQGTHGHAGPSVTYAPKPRHHKVLPRQCRRVEHLQGHVIRGLGKRCLKRQGVNVHALPGHCAIKVRNAETGKRKVIYGGRCLRQHGYTLARAH